MNLQLRDWTCERIQALPAEQRLALTYRAAGELLQSKILLGRCLLVIQRTRAYEECGSSSVHHFATLELGLDQRETREALLTATRLEALPKITEAIESNQISWSKLQLILRRADPDDEAYWLQKAEELNVRGLEKLVRRQADKRDGKSEWTHLEVLLPAETMILLQHAFRNLSEQAGRRLSIPECLECLAAENLSGKPFPDESALSKLRDGAARDLAAQQQLEEEADHWETVAAEEVETAGHQVVKPTKAIWENPKLQFTPSNRAPTPAQRREILRRDGYRCSVPGCPHTLWLEVHHMVSFCEGGPTIPGNLISLCRRCHRHLHRGLITLDKDRIWRDRNGRELGTGAPPKLSEPTSFETNWSTGPAQTLPGEPDSSA